MTENVWKAYEDNQLTHSAAHYLMAIDSLVEERGYARVTDIARHLNITRGSCSISLKPLKRRGLVLEDENKFLRLSEEGRRLARLVEHNDKLLEYFFREVLGVSPDQAEIDACKIEHLLSIEASLALHHFVRAVAADHPAARAFLDELRATREERCREPADACDLCEDLCFLDAVHPDEAGD